MMTRLVQRITSIVPCGRVTVDLGCGAGEILDHVAKFCDVPFGLDISAKRLSKRAHAPQAWSFVCADLNLPFPLNSNCADTVFANQVIEHISDPLFFAVEIHRILRPGGRAVVTSPNVRYFKQVWRLVAKGLGPRTANQNTLNGKWDDGHIHYFTHSDLRRIFIHAGFKHVISKAFINLSGNMAKLRSILDLFSKSYFVREFSSGNIILVAEK